MRKILKTLFIIQEKKVQGKPFKRARLNPYNPLSYPALILIIIIGIILFGIVGFWKETDMQNPFKWA